MPVRDVIVIGAGPAGLATAIAARQHRLDCQVLERGMIVNTVFHFPRHMVFFTTPELLEIGNLPFVTPYEKPTRLEALRYYRRVVDTYQLDVSLGEEVIRVEPSAAGLDIHTRCGDGEPRRHETRAAVLATGCYDHPNRLDVPGEDLPHVSHYYTEAHPYYRKRVVIVGGKNSAAEAALELCRAGASVTLVHRGVEPSDSIKYWVRPDLLNRIAEGSIAAHFLTRVLSISKDGVRVSGRDGERTLPADAVLLLIGYHSDTHLFDGCGIGWHPETLEPEHDAETLETNVPSLYLAGSVVSGRQSGKIFIENGRFHGEAVVATIVRRLRERPHGD